METPDFNHEDGMEINVPANEEHLEALEAHIKALDDLLKIRTERLGKLTKMLAEVSEVAEIKDGLWVISQKVNSELKNFKLPETDEEWNKYLALMDRSTELMNKICALEEEIEELFESDEDEGAKD